MAVPMTAAQWRTQMRKWGAPFQEYSGWSSRQRPGAFSPVGIVIHHTGSDGGQNSPTYDHFLFVEGRPAEGIPGPLCQSACEMDGDVLLGAIGRANHAGKGASNTLNLVKAGNAPTGSEINPGADSLDGNAQYYGLEVKYDGGQPMTAKQYESALRWAAAICDFYGWDEGHVIGHREHTKRKGDPGNCPMDRFRRDLASLLKTAGSGGNTPTPPTTGGLTVSDVQTILTKLDALHEIASGRWVQDIEENRAQTRQLVALLQAQDVQIKDLTARLAAEDAQDDAFDALTGQRWAQGIDEQRKASAVALEQAQAILAKLDSLQPPAGGPEA